MNNKQNDLQEAVELNKKSRGNAAGGGMTSSVNTGMTSGMDQDDLQEAKELNKKSRENMK